ncbi:MAG: LytTR family transcriptional regulator DNA-binding domain-containing protein [Acetatifactor sp.]|nr:LytTR family transcriptional regulator DNA-binding domain-containing protein [Acetatifactor sp.]
MYRIGICEVKARGVLERGISHYSEKEKLKLEMQVWDTVEELMDDLFAGMELDVLYMCSDLRRIHVKTTRGNYEFNGLLRDLKKTLPKDFLVIHKSFIVNREHVLYFTYEKVTLSDGTILSISKANRSRAKSMLMSGR